MNDQKTRRVVIIGCGDMGQTHAGAWQENPHTTIVGASDPLEERLQAFAEKYKVPDTSADYQTVIDQAQPDIVSVCVPAFLHPEVTAYAAERGAHVLCEKPLALTIEEARTMITGCAEHGVLLGTCFQRRYWGNTVFYKKQVAEGTFGTPIFWKRQDIREVRPKTLMHEKRGNGGAIVDCAVHWFDQWRTILNANPIRVYARGGCFGRGKPLLKDIQNFAVDTGMITVEYEGGHVGEVTMCWGLPEKTQAVEAEVVMGPNAVATRKGSTITLNSGNSSESEDVSPFSHQPIINAFADAVIEGAPLPATGEDGLIALRVSLAALESMETGKPVNTTT